MFMVTASSRVFDGDGSYENLIHLKTFRASRGISFLGLYRLVYFVVRGRQSVWKHF